MIRSSVIRRRVLVFCCASGFAGPSADLVPDISWILVVKVLACGELSLKQ
jgi:hypothetical protein